MSEEFLFYFGAWGEPGHYLWKPGRTCLHGAYLTMGGHWRFGAQDLDGNRLFLPTKDDPAEPRKLSRLIVGERCMTIIGWWSRRFDTRPGSCALVIGSGWDTEEYLLRRFRYLFNDLAGALLDGTPLRS